MRTKTLNELGKCPNFMALHQHIEESKHPIEVEPLTSRAGRQFRPTRELEILPFLHDAARTLPAQYDSAVVLIPECPLPVGVPDLVAVVANRVALSARLQSGIPPVLAEQEARLVSLCGPKRGASYEQLARALSLSSTHTKRLLGRLVSSGALIREGSRWYRDEIMGPIGRVYALEAKASDWKAGFYQSMRYAGYADASILTLGKISDRVEFGALEIAHRSGVGLFINGTWRSQPKVRFLPIERRLWVSEHIVAAMDHDRSYQIPSATAYSLNPS